MTHPYLSHTTFSSISILLNLSFSAYIGVSINLFSIFTAFCLRTIRLQMPHLFYHLTLYVDYTHKMLTQFLRDEPFLPPPIPNSY